MNKNDTLIKLGLAIIQTLTIAVLINVWDQLKTSRSELIEVRQMASNLRERVKVLEVLGKVEPNDK